MASNFGESSRARTGILRFRDAYIHHSCSRLKTVCAPTFLIDQEIENWCDPAESEDSVDRAKFYFVAVHKLCNFIYKY
jgi:hypothetical protein